MTRRTALGAVITALALPITAATLAAADTDSAPSTGASMSGATARPLGVFETAAAPAANPNARARVAATTRLATGRDPSDVRLARSEADLDIYVATAAESVCLVQLGAAAGAGCTLASTVARPDSPAVLVDILEAGRWRVTALSSDDVASIRVHSVDGSVKVVNQAHNVGTAVVTSEPARLAWDVGSKEHSLDVTGLDR